METVRFEEMGLSEEIQKAVRYMGFEEASPIQAKAIPAMISGIDLIGQAQTGTGKTAAFGIPILARHYGAAGRLHPMRCDPYRRDYGGTEDCRTGRDLRR